MQLFVYDTKMYPERKIVKRSQVVLQSWTIKTQNLNNTIKRYNIVAKGEYINIESL